MVSIEGKILRLALGFTIIGSGCAPVFTGQFPTDGSAIPLSEPLIDKSACQSPLTVEKFAQQLVLDNSNNVAGVFAACKFALTVIQPPPNLTVPYVDPVEITQYQLPPKNHVIGLYGEVAGNGSLFNLIKPEDEVDVILGTGKILRFRIVKKDTVIALQPNSVNSNFMDLNGNKFTTQEIADRYYVAKSVTPQLTLQTCVNIPGWDLVTDNGKTRTKWAAGRVFFIGEPIDKPK
jgi:hypothetical protein